jgi:hypothetical protein
MSILGDSGGAGASLPRYQLAAFTVKRKAAGVWEIWHAGALVCIVNQARALAFIRGEVDPAALASDTHEAAA